MNESEYLEQEGLMFPEFTQLSTIYRYPYNDNRMDQSEKLSELFFLNNLVKDIDTYFDNGNQPGIFAKWKEFGAVNNISDFIESYSLLNELVEDWLGNYPVSKPAQEILKMVEGLE